MPIPVSVEDVAGMMESASDEVTAYLNPKTGEFFVWSEDWCCPPEEETDLSSYPEWLREAIVRYREVCDSENWLVLPSKFDIHEWDIMRRYCQTVESDSKRERLLDAIHGKSAFRRFKDTAHNLGLIDEWYEYRGNALREIAIDWLEENDIPYTTEKRKES